METEITPQKKKTSWMLLKYELRTSTSGPDEKHDKPNIWKFSMSCLWTSARHKQLEAAQVRPQNKHIESRALQVRLTTHSKSDAKKVRQCAREKADTCQQTPRSRNSTLRVLDTRPTRVSVALGEFNMRSKANLISHSGLFQPAPRSVGQAQTPLRP